LSGDRAARDQAWLTGHVATSMLALAALLVFPGCTEPAPTEVPLVGVEPTSAYSDAARVLTVMASVDSMLRPALDVDISGQSAWFDQSTLHLALVPPVGDPLPIVPLGVVRWTPRVSTTLEGSSPVVYDVFQATIPAGVAPGFYDVRLDLPSHKVAVLRAGFHELGPDPEAPTLSVSSPGVEQVLPAGLDVTAMISADDGAGQIHDVLLETPDGPASGCDIESVQARLMFPYNADLPSRVVFCPATFATPPLDDAQVMAPYWLRVSVHDVAGHEASRTVSLWLTHTPEITSFENTVGSLAGYQPFVVHGRFFLPGTQATIGRVPIVGTLSGGGSVPGGIVVDDMTIMGLTPPHSLAEEVPVEVRSDAGAATLMARFRYVAPPRIRVIFPATGPTSGGIKVTVAGNDLSENVTILVGATLETAKPLGPPLTYAADDKVVGCLPPGQGTVSVWARDPVTGVSLPYNGFAYTDVAADGTAPALPDPACATAMSASAAVPP
jgi:hypothetical protein